MSDSERELIEVLIRLAQGDLSARMERSFERDADDTVAYFINLLATEFDRLLTQRDQDLRDLETSVAVLSERFVALAAGNYDIQAPRTGSGDPMDVLAFLFNNTAAEVGQAVRALEDQRSVLEAILEAMLDPVLIVDSTAVVRKANSAALALFGAQDLVGMPLAHLFSVNEGAFAAELFGALQAGPIRERETTLALPSGPALLTVNASAHRRLDGSVQGIVLVIRDDRDLRQARAQLQMTDRLAAIGTMAAGVAHEINNPLAFVLTNLEYVLEELDRALDDAAARAELRSAIEAAQRGGERVRQIVQDLRAFSRGDRDTYGPVDVNHLIESAVAMLGNELKHHARVQLDLRPVAPVEANEAKLGQVFINLVHNAAQAIPPGHAADNTVCVRTRSDPEGRVRIEVSDTGQGIDPVHMGRIFDAFFTTKPVGVGTGLGLSICHRVVTDLGGTIDVASTVGSGTTFTVALPPSVSVAFRSAEAPAAPPSPERRRVLVIDDEAEVGQSIRRILGRSNDVDVVQRASAALTLLGEASYDVVLCDLMMPDMTGMEFHAHVARTRPELLPRLLFMTGGAFSPEARQFLASLAAPHVEKPFDTTALRALVEAVAGRH